MAGENTPPARRSFVPSVAGRRPTFDNAAGMGRNFVSLCTRSRLLEFRPRGTAAHPVLNPSIRIVWVCSWVCEPGLSFSVFIS